MRLALVATDTIAEDVWAKLVAGDDTEDGIEIAGLGSVSVRTYRAYEGRNSRTGELVHVPFTLRDLPF